MVHKPNIMFTISAQIVVILSDKSMSNAFKCPSNMHNTMNDNKTPKIIAHINSIHNINMNHWFAVHVSAHNNFFNSISL